MEDLLYSYNDIPSRPRQSPCQAAMHGSWGNIFENVYFFIVYIIIRLHENRESLYYIPGTLNIHIKVRCLYVGAHTPGHLAFGCH